MYNTGSPYQAILTAARKAEAEAEHYKETEAASAKGAQAVSPEVLEELAAIKGYGQQSLELSAEASKGRTKRLSERRWET